MRRICLLLVFAGCLPPDSPPPKAAAPPDPDLAVIAHAWRISGHVLGTRPTLGDRDASALDGRTIDISSTGYVSPWQGTCDDAGRSKRERVLSEVAIENDLSAQGRAELAGRGFGKPLVEFRLTCSNARSPPLTLYVAGASAFTCWSGVCYVLTGGR
jgi:hypothetical protein